jgi:UrcA family protein
MIRFAIAAVAAVLIAGPALADSETAGVSVKVKTSDLNLQTEAGAKTALQRINRAAKSACSEVSVGSRMPTVDQGCVADVTDKLVKQLKAPMVEAVYSAQKSDKLSQG